jgi:uncharacterized protein (DUF1800 family)
MPTEELTLDTPMDTTTDAPEATRSTSPSSSVMAPASLSLLAAALLAACGGGGGGGSASGTSSTPDAGPANKDLPSANGFNNYPKATSDEEAARFLLNGQLEASETEITAVRSSTSYAAYLQDQFAKPIGQTGWQWLELRGYATTPTIHNYFFSDYPATFMLWSQLFSSQDSMRKRAALSLSEFFVASLQSAEFTWRSHGFAQYWDLLVSNAFGNFRKLLEDVTLSPAMGYYLNTKGNQKEDIASGRVPDENYAREVMQLFTIGLYKLNLDGTEQTDGAGKKLETYTQDDVTNLARVFTGYDFDRSDGERNKVLKQDGSEEPYTVEGRAFTQKPMSFTASKHSTLQAQFLGATVAANTPGPAALKIALDTLFNHPNVGPFFAKQMIQRMVTSNPSPAYVARVASAFNNNGAGVRGDLKAVWVAILLDDEARNPAQPGNKDFGKLREPMLRFIQWGRTFGLTSQGGSNSQNGSWKIGDTSNASTQLGQSPLRAPSVFNFFRPGFVPPGTALAATKTTAPEFQIVNETTVGGYLNFLQDIVRTGFYTGNPNVPNFTNNEAYTITIAPTYAKELALVADAAALVRRLNLLLCAGQMSAATQTTIVTALNANAITATSTADAKLNRVAGAVLLTMACPEYLIQK